MKTTPYVLFLVVAVAGCGPTPSKVSGFRIGGRPTPTPQQLREEAAYQKAWTAATEAHRKGDFAQARRHFEAVRKLRPNDSLASLKLADVYSKLGSPKKALAAYEEAFRPKNGLGSLGTAARPDVYVRYGNLLEASGNRSRALDMYWNALAFPLPGDPVGYKPRNDSFASVKSAAHLRAGLDIVQTGSGTDGLQEMERAIAADRQAWRTYFQYGVHLAGSRHRDGMAALDKAERLAPPEEKALARDRRRQLGLVDEVTVFSYQPDGTSKTVRLSRAEYEKRR